MKKIIFILIIIVSIFVANNLIRSIYNLWKKQDLLTQAKQELKAEKEKNQYLKSQLDYVSNEKFVEEEARNKLFLLKPNEQIVVLKDLNQEKESVKIIDNRPNWKKWLALFFQSIK